MSSILKLFLVVCTLGVGFFASDLYRWVSTRSQVKPLSEYCPLTTQACELGNIRVEADRDISQPLVPTKLIIDWPSTEVQSLLVVLQGYEMEMGTLMFKLNKSGAHQYSGSVTLPVCTSSTMTWVGEITDGQQSISTSIRMEQ